MDIKKWSPGDFSINQVVFLHVACQALDIKSEIFFFLDRCTTGVKSIDKIGKGREAIRKAVLHEMRHWNPFGIIQAKQALESNDSFQV